MGWYSGLIVITLGIVGWAPAWLMAQQPPAASPPQAVVQASASGAAATVNGEVISEAAVQRELKFAAPQDVAKLRPAIVNNLVELMLIDQYLRSAKAVSYTHLTLPTNREV